MAYLKPIIRRLCRCGKIATVELVNRFNGHVGYYCAQHGRAELRRLDSEHAPKDEQNGNPQR
jgi:hypothetical protein